MAFKFAIGRVTDPDVLIPHLFEAIDPGFVGRVKPGDLIIAGQEFGCGKPHLTGFIAMQALGLGVLCESMPARALRGAVSKGLPVLDTCKGILDFVASGEELDINYETGEAHNISRDTRISFPAMPKILQELIASGGAVGKLRKWLDAHPEQRATAPLVPLEESGAAYMPLKFVPGKRP